MNFLKISPVAFITFSRAGKYIGILFLTILSIFIYGYTFGTSTNLDQVLPFIQKIQNPTLYPQDPYIKTLSFFPSIYPYFISYLGRFFSLPLVHVCLYIALKYIMLLVVFNLAQYIFPQRRTGWLACFLFAFSPLTNTHTILGEDPLMKTMLYHTSFVGPFMLLALLLFMKRKYVLSFCLVGLMYYFNGLIANFLLVMFALASARDIKPVIRGWVVFILIWAPWLVWYLSVSKLSGNFSTSFLVTLQSWYPGHYFPSQWELPKWKDLIIVVTFFSTFFYQGLKRARSASQIEVFLSSIAIMWFMAFVAAELIPNPRLVLLQFFRSDVFFISLGLIFAADCIREMLDTKSLPHMALGGLVLLVLIEVGKPYLVLPVLIVYLFSLSPHRFIYKVSLIIFLILLVCFASVARSTFSMQKILLATLFLSFLLVAKPGERPLTSVRASIVSVIIIFLMMVSYIPVFVYRIKTHDFAYQERSRHDWEQLQYWVKDNTPLASVFIVPPYRDGFRVFSQRSPVVEWVDGSAMHWSPGFEKEWLRRIRDLGFEEYRVIPSLRFAESQMTIHLGEKRVLITSHPFAIQAAITYSSLDEAKLIKLAQKYGAGYVVREDDKLQAFPLIYQNRTFRLYRIPKG